MLIFILTFGTTLGLLACGASAEPLTTRPVSNPPVVQKSQVVPRARQDGATPSVKDRTTKRGQTFNPEANDQVQIGFERGGTANPVVTGNVWNGNDRLPENGSGRADRNKRPIRAHRPSE
jgi:Type VI secretion system/phage-baseplate injector OB domain